MSDTIANTYDESVDPVKTYEKKAQVNYDFYNRVIATKSTNAAVAAKFLRLQRMNLEIRGTGRADMGRP